MSYSKQLLNSLLLVVAAFLCPALLLAQSKFTGIVEKDGKYGIEVKTDRGTELVVKPKYDDIKLIYNSIPPRVYAYKAAGKWGIIDLYNPKTNIVTQPEFDSIKMLNSIHDFVFGLKNDYFLVWKAGKVALFASPKDNATATYTLWDDIGFDTAAFSKNYKYLFHFKVGNLYGLTNLNREMEIKPEYESYQKINTGFRTYFHILKKNNRYLIVHDPYGGPIQIQKTVDTFWVDKELFSVTGTDTLVHDMTRTESISEYRAKNITEEKKNEPQRLKQEKVARILNAHYQKKQRVLLSSTKEMYLLIDSFGIKCFDPENAEYVFADKQLVHYYINNNLVFVQSEQGKWYLYPNSAMEYKSITTVHPYVAAQVSDEQYWIFGGVKSRQVYVEKGAEITEVTNLDNSVHIVYRLNGKYGFVSQNNFGDRLKSLPAVFTSISVISTYQNNPRLQLVYNGETVNAYHDNIQMEFGGKHTGIKADIYGAVCGNPKCKNGIVSTTTRVEKGKTTTTTYSNTTYWYKGHLMPADITITETNPDRLITEKTYCTDPVHSVKVVMLFWDKPTGTYKVEKH